MQMADVNKSVCVHMVLYKPILVSEKKKFTTLTVLTFEAKLDLES